MTTKKKHWILQHAGKFEVLEPEQERHLWKKWFDEEDLDVKNRIINSHLRICVKYSYKYRRDGVDLDDLLSVSYIGLLKAFTSYNSTKNARFSTWVHFDITSEVTDYLANQVAYVKCGGTAFQKFLFWHYNEKLTQLSADNPDQNIDQLHSEMIKEWKASQKKWHSIPSLEKGLKDYLEAVKIEVLPINDQVINNSFNPLKHIESRDSKRFLMHAWEEFQTLPEQKDKQRNNAIFEKVHLTSENAPTQSSLSKEFGISGSRVGAIVDDVRFKFVQFSREKYNKTLF